MGNESREIVKYFLAPNSILDIAVWDKDNVSDDLMCHVCFDVSDLLAESVIGWYQLGPAEGADEELTDFGDLKLDIKYHGTKRPLRVDSITPEHMIQNPDITVQTKSMINIRKRLSAFSPQKKSDFKLKEARSSEVLGKARFHGYLQKIDKEITQNQKYYCVADSELMILYESRDLKVRKEVF